MERVEETQAIIAGRFVWKQALANARAHAAEIGLEIVDESVERRLFTVRIQLTARGGEAGFAAFAAYIDSLKPAGDSMIGMP